MPPMDMPANHRVGAVLKHDPALPLAAMSRACSSARTRPSR